MSQASTLDQHVTRAEIEAGLGHIQASPKDDGVLEMVVIRPAVGERQVLETCDVSAEGGVHGDAWARGCWLSLPDGRPHPDVQVAIMNARMIALVAGEKDRWPLAGDNLYVDLDLSQENLQPGQRLAVGSVILEITAEWHGPCKKFVARYGAPAAQHMNAPIGKELRLRGVYAKVVRDGTVGVGDRVAKLD